MISVSIKTKLALKSDIVKETDNSLKRVLRVLGLVLPERFKEAFRGPAKQQGRPGLPEWVETSRIAKMKRRLFPKGGVNEQRGEKGLTQKQAQYLFTAPTLVDTGKLRDSIEAIDMRTDPKGEYFLVLGSKSKYAKIHLEGGSATVNGKTISVPKRDFLLLNPDDEIIIDETVKEMFD